MRFIGVDLGWMSQPTGLAALCWDGAQFGVEALERLPDHAGVLAWVERTAGAGPAMLAIDAPLVIPNKSGIRPCERGVNADFRRYHAGCHAANQGRPFYSRLHAFVGALEDMGFRHAAEIIPGAPGRYMIEVHPHAASVALFHLDRIVKYKRGRIAGRARELARYRALVQTVVTTELPAIPSGGRELKSVEDRIDAVLAAYVGARWWLWGSERTRVYGDAESGYIVVPRWRGEQAVATCLPSAREQC